MLRAISGIGEIAEHFDAFILDLWGLVHDGERLYPPAAETLRRIKRRRKKNAIAVQCSATGLLPGRRHDQNGS